MLPIKKIPNDGLNFILNGGKKSFTVNSKDLGVKRQYEIDYMGIESFIKDQLNNNESKSLRRWALQFVDVKKCKSCIGSRLKVESRSFRINNRNIFELSEMDLSELKEWFKEINNYLSEKEIRISDVRIVDNDFHSRFNARSKEYNYYCTLDENPLDVRNHYYVKNVNIEILNNISQLIIGEHDFLSFSKFSNKENNRCAILKSEWILDRSNNKLLYIVRGNRFLHHMVRYLVGTMIATAQNKMTKKEFKRLLAEPIKDAKIYKSPAKGLILKEIFYED